MPDTQFKRRLTSRRTMMKTALAGACGLVVAATSFSKAAQATENESTEMNPTELINALRLIGKPACLDAADRLAASTGSLAGFDLNLRNAGLNEADARVLAKGMLNADAGQCASFKIFQRKL